MRTSPSRRPSRSSPPAPLPAPMPIRAWFTATDLAAALKASRRAPMVSDEELHQAALEVSYWVDSALAKRTNPTRADLDRIVASLRTIETHAAATLSAIVALLPGWNATAEDPHAALTAHIAASQIPAVLALLSAMMAERQGAPAVKLADVIISLDHLRGWAAVAANAYPGPRTRRQAESLDQGLEASHDPSQERRLAVSRVGAALIAVYTKLTGTPSGRSRRKPGSEQEGAPGGPVIRFLTEAFERIRANLAKEATTLDMARNPAWSPTAETFVNWITQSRTAASR